MAAAHLGINYTPYLVGGLIDKFSFGPASMGVFATAETLAFAIAMFVFAPRAQTFRPRQMALIASGVIALVQVGSAMTAILPLLILGRVATGFGYGMLNTAVNVAAARTGQPARAISVGISLQVLVFMVMNLTIPQIGAWGGVGAMFIALGIISGALALGMLPLTNTTETGNETADEAVPPIAPGGWPVLAAMALFAFGTMAIWPFMERAAHAIGLPATAFGRYQSLSNLLSSLGNFALTILLARGLKRGLLEVALSTARPCLRSRYNCTMSVGTSSIRCCWAWRIRTIRMAGWRCARPAPGWSRNRPDRWRRGSWRRRRRAMVWSAASA